MKLIVLSDLHLSAKFDPKQFDKLHNAIQGSDQVILNGDFWDSFITDFDSFVNSKWSNLFPLLKAKNTIYLYGNHDPQKYTDQRVNLFSVAQEHHYKLAIDGHKLHFHHGNEIALKGGESKTIAFLARNIEKPLRMFAEPVVNTLLQGLNEKMKQWAKQNLAIDEILVCGHTHIQELALNQQFINSGYNCYGKMQYLLVDDGQIKLIND
jgi:predicted phosphodiesterase